jgi:hypothetical protein
VCGYAKNQKRRVNHGASLLCQVPQKERDPESEADHLEEQTAGDKWYLSGLQDQGIQDWQGLGPAASV